MNGESLKSQTFAKERRIEEYTKTCPIKESTYYL